MSNKVLIGAGVLGVMYLFLRPKPKIKATVTTPGGGGGVSLGGMAAPAGPCLPNPLTSADDARLRAMVEAELPHVNLDDTPAQQAVWASARVMSEVCPELPVPDEEYQVPSHRDANGARWTEAWDVVFSHASAKLSPPPV